MRHAVRSEWPSYAIIIQAWLAALYARLGWDGPSMCMPGLGSWIPSCGQAWSWILSCGQDGSRVMVCGLCMHTRPRWVGGGADLHVGRHLGPRSSEELHRARGRGVRAGGGVSGAGGLT